MIRRERRDGGRLGEIRKGRRERIEKGSSERIEIERKKKETKESYRPSHLWLPMAAYDIQVVSAARVAFGKVS